MEVFKCDRGNLAISLENLLLQVLQNSNLVAELEHENLLIGLIADNWSSTFNEVFHVYN